MIGRHDFLNLFKRMIRRVPNKSNSTYYKEDRYQERSRLWIYIDVTADGFLYKMVRNIAGNSLAIMPGNYSSMKCLKY